VNGKDRLEDLGIDGRMILEWIDWIHDSGGREICGSFEHGNEISGAIKGGDFLD
jgi:hypothetical protein